MSLKLISNGANIKVSLNKNIGPKSINFFLKKKKKKYINKIF